MEIIIRRATLEDVPTVAKLHVDNWNETYKGIIAQDHLDNMRNNIDARIERMKNQFNDRIMLVATINNEIVAFSEYTETNKYSQDLEADCELCGLYVKNEYKGHGIGSKLFNYIQDEFRKNSSKTM